jgi:hypothetical protein
VDPLSPLFIDTSSSGFYFWIDAPDIPMFPVYKLPDGTTFTADVVEVHVTYNFLFRLRNKKNPLKSCVGQLSLKLDVTGGRLLDPHWQDS